MDRKCNITVTSEHSKKIDISTLSNTTHMNSFINNILTCNDSRYYYLLLKLEYILREHIHFENNNFQQERIKTWWRVNRVYYEDIEKALDECDISHVYCNGLFNTGWNDRK